jgi:N-acetyl-gamma-glutamylphosphate reductase
MACSTWTGVTPCAATQALQNMNLALGCGEFDGIPPL